LGLDKLLAIPKLKKKKSRFGLIFYFHHRFVDLIQKPSSVYLLTQKSIEVEVEF
jgi:hypothetical protein